jgi:hypothetical protein
MDLLATVRKEGSRGGTGDFKWSDVQSSSHREHYLGHSLMAPVGRWQKGRDLNWYANSQKDDAHEGESAEDQAARQRAEEIKKIKEAEQDAMARALGLPVPDRSNPNTEALGNRREMEKVVKEGAGGDDSGGKGIGYSTTGTSQREGPLEDVERIEGNAEQQDRELDYALKEYKRRHGNKHSRRRSRSRSRDPDRKHAHRPRDRDRDKARDRDRKHRHHHSRRQRSRSSSGGRRRRSPIPEYSSRSRRDRSRSPKRRTYDQR